MYLCGVVSVASDSWCGAYALYGNWGKSLCPFHDEMVQFAHISQLWRIPFYLTHGLKNMWFFSSNCNLDINEVQKHKDKTAVFQSGNTTHLSIIVLKSRTPAMSLAANLDKHF